MRALTKLGVKEYALVIRAGIWTAAVRVGLSTLAFRTLRELIMNRGKPTGSRYHVEQVVWAVRAVSRYVPKATCLTQALVVQRFLMKSGHECRLHFGVAKDAVRGFEAHAWVECGDRVVIGESAGVSITKSFTPIAVWEN